MNINTLTAIAGAIRELKEVPSGHLYAHLMGKVGLSEYNVALRTLEKAGMVTVKSHLITWTEPACLA